MSVNNMQASTTEGAASTATGANAPQPDADSVKMFVGQVPKAWNETDMRKLLEEFGPIYYINILRDQVSGESKGCCFVTYYSRKSAMDASASLHNRRTLPGCQHPIQMKCADSESRKVEDRKLFIGMLAKTYGEEEVRNMFQDYGNIEEIRVLRDPESHSRGCAFVIFSTKYSAESAIKALHHSQIMDGCSSPLVVKFAETSKEKEQKKLQQMTSQLWNGVHALGPGYFNIMQQAAQAMGGTAAPINTPPNPAAMQQLMQLAQQFNNATGGGGPAAPTPANPAATLAAAAAAAAAGQFGGAAGGSGGAGGIGPPSAATQWGQFGGGGSAGGAGNHFGASAAAAGFGQFASNLNQVAGKQQEGPEGSNLFIYHLPKEFTDTDLAQTFAPFGNVISAKVFIDKVTSTSKGFGFVSYDNAVSSQAAIQAMNGFQIGMKRLKVSVKRSKADGKPY